MGAGGDGCDRIGNSQATVVVAVPVDADLFAARLHDFIDGKFDEVVGALRRGVADRIAENYSAGAVADRGGIETLDGVAIGAGGVFGYVHGWQAVVDGEPYSFFRGALEVVDGPVFDKAADGAGAEEGSGFERDSDALGNFNDGTDVGFYRSGGAVRANLHVVVGDFASQGLGVGRGAWARAG